MNSPFIWYMNVGRTFIRFVTIHACDGRTDGRLCDRKDRVHTMQRGKNYGVVRLLVLTVTLRNFLFVIVVWKKNYFT